MSCPRCDWEDRYDAAMQWRDWPTCDLLLEERPPDCDHFRREPELDTVPKPGYYYDGEE